MCRDDQQGPDKGHPAGVRAVYLESSAMVKEVQPVAGRGTQPLPEVEP